MTHNGHYKGCTTPESCWCETKRYGWVLLVALLILLGEIAGGIYAHSLALLADAGHVFADAGALLVGILVAYRVRRGASEARTRAVGGYINAFLLGAVALWIAVEAYHRFMHPRDVVDWVMIGVGAAGGMGNYVQHRILHSAHAHHITHESIRLHVLGDLLQSAIVVAGGIAIWLTGATVVDPLLSVLIALIMARWTVKLLVRLYQGEYTDGHGHHH